MFLQGGSEKEVVKKLDLESLFLCHVGDVLRARIRGLAHDIYVRVVRKLVPSSPQPGWDYVFRPMVETSSRGEHHTDSNDDSHVLLVSEVPRVSTSPERSSNEILIRATAGNVDRSDCPFRFYNLSEEDRLHVKSLVFPSGMR